MQLTDSQTELIEHALRQSIDYQTYFNQVTRFYEQQATSGPDQSMAMTEYTALNYKRMKRLNKTLMLNEEYEEFLKNLSTPQTWLVITEAWCGDAAQITPVLFKMAEASPAITLRFVYRDEHPELMDTFLTNGARSIPKLIARDATTKILFTWGPRPQLALALVEDFKSKNKVLTDTFKQELQNWYNKDKGKSTVNDLVDLLKKRYTT